MTTFITNAFNNIASVVEVDTEQQYPLGTVFEGFLHEDSGARRLVMVKYVKAGAAIPVDSANDEEGRMVASDTSGGITGAAGTLADNVKLHGSDDTMTDELQGIGVLIADGYEKDTEVVTSIASGEYFWVVTKGLVRVKMPSAAFPAKGDRLRIGANGYALAGAAGQPSYGIVAKDTSADALVECQVDFSSYPSVN